MPQALSLRYGPHLRQGERPVGTSARRSRSLTAPILPVVTSVYDRNLPRPTAQHRLAVGVSHTLGPGWGQRVDARRCLQEVADEVVVEAVGGERHGMVVGDADQDDRVLGELQAIEDRNCWSAHFSTTFLGVGVVGLLAAHAVAAPPSTGSQIEPSIIGQDSCPFGKNHGPHVACGANDFTGVVRE